MRCIASSISYLQLNFVDPETIIKPFTGSMTHLSKPMQFWKVNFTVARETLMLATILHLSRVHLIQSFVLALMLAICASAQTVTIDATPSHVANTFSPLHALGTTLDRIPSNTTDIFFRPDQIKQILEAGWGPVSYRQN